MGPMTAKQGWFWLAGTTAVFVLVGVPYATLTHSWSDPIGPWVAGSLGFGYTMAAIDFVGSLVTRERKTVSMTPLEALREAYANDVIDLETFERFAQYDAEGRAYVLPRGVGTPSRAPTLANATAVLKGMYGSGYERRYDWEDGHGAVHSRPLPSKPVT